MPGTSYDALKNKQQELIRKALDGSVFIGDSVVDPLTTLTVMSGDTVPVPVLNALPDGWDDLGFLTTDGAQFARESSSSEVTSWGSVSPTRTDVVSDTTSLTVTAQETKLLTIGLATGADLANFTLDASTRELRIAKPVRPKGRHYRALSLAVDQADEGEIFIGRFLPNAKVSSYAEQSFGGGDEAIPWGVTLTGELDSELGYSEQWLFGGQGWYALCEKMGFDITP